MNNTVRLRCHDVAAVFVNALCLESFSEYEAQPITTHSSSPPPLRLSRYLFIYLFWLAQYFWIFSEVLEPLAIVPQLMMLQRYREVENLTGRHFCLVFVQARWLAYSTRSGGTPRGPRATILTTAILVELARVQKQQQQAACVRFTTTAVRLR